MQDEGPEARVLELTVGRSAGPRRIDAYLAARLQQYSRTFLKRLIEEGWVTVDGRRVKPAHVPRPGERITVRLPELRAAGIEPEDVELDIIYEDEWLLVVNKPPDMVVHPAKGHLAGTLVNAAVHHCRQLSRQGEELRPGVVHRLDRDTSGVILLVKDPRVHEDLAAQFQARTVSKEYVAVCEGRIELDEDVIDAPIGRHPRVAEKMAVRPDAGKPARTLYSVVERLGGFSVVRCYPQSGRTHQIRVHLQLLGHPIVCDSLYGFRDAIYLSDIMGRERAPSEEPLLERQALHARRITIRHPALGRQMCFEAPVPEDMMALVRALRERHAGD